MTGLRSRIELLVAARLRKYFLLQARAPLIRHRLVERGLTTSQARIDVKLTV